MNAPYAHPRVAPGRAGVVTPQEYFDLAYGLDIGRGEPSDRAIVREVRARTARFSACVTLSGTPY